MVATDRKAFSDIRADNGRVIATTAAMSNLTDLLAGAVNRPVVDETGLNGTYDFTLNWTPDDPPAGPPEEYHAPADGPSLFTAITEQLGLRLESKRAPAPVFVIEKIETPGEN
ncbi:MAG TPA: TIGR03435 family protein [Bryobacteraceae bacterium]|nr:TIGR03435 family protein [Bryobacteraceae bacterium]